VGGSPPNHLSAALRASWIVVSVNVADGGGVAGEFFDCVNKAFEKIAIAGREFEFHQPLFFTVATRD
jgi:hypothetical protein